MAGGQTTTLQSPLLAAATLAAAQAGSPSRLPGRQCSEPVTPSAGRDTSTRRCVAHRQFSEPSKATLFAGMDPRVVAMCRQVSGGIAEVALDFAPALFPIPPLPAAKPLQQDCFSELDSDDEAHADDGIAPAKPALRCVLSEEDAWPVMAVSVWMSATQGTAYCSFFGAIGYFSRLWGMPQLFLYVGVTQAILLPLVLDMQRRYDHMFDARFGHKVTFLFRIVVLSILQSVLILAAPFLPGPWTFMLAASASAAITVMVFGPVCMVVSCVEGAQAVNFARTASHAGGVMVLILSTFWQISTRSSFESVFCFFLSASALQVSATLMWFREHLKNTSLDAAYAVIAAQHSHTAQEVAQQKANVNQDDTGAYTFESMFGLHRVAGLAILASFTIAWTSWTVVQSVMNMFGDEDLTQWLVLLTYPADTAGRLLSHLMHGCANNASTWLPVPLLHSVTACCAVASSMLMADTSLNLLSTQVLSIVMFVLCFVTTFTVNELSTKSIEVAKSRAQVAHCQTLIIFAATGFSRFVALFLQLARDNL